MVLVRDFNIDVIRLYVRLRMFSFAILSGPPLTPAQGPTHPSTHYQLQVEERGSHADEGHGLQDSFHGERLRLRYSFEM